MTDPAPHQPDPPHDPVAEQYRQWPYPAPTDDLTKIPWSAPECRYKDLRELYWLYWPSAAPRDDLDVLVAGCGSTAAAAYAYLYPRCRVLGIDVSSTSLAHEESLRRKHNLANLSLRLERVEDAASLGSQFDFIACHGVLHHLADPVAGLRALGKVLRPDGVIDIMVYGRYGRAGVYMLQELFRLLHVPQSAEGLLTVRECLAALSPAHPVQRYLRLATDLAADAGLVDTFLHCRDQPFSVRDCLGLVAEAGLAFQVWDDNGLYHPEAHLPPGHPLRARLGQLAGPDLWQAVELFYGNTPGHWFAACRADRDRRTYAIQFDDQAFLNYFPVPRITQATPADPYARRPATIARPPFPPIPIDDWQAALFAQLDARRTVRQCLAAIGDDTPAAHHRAGAFFRMLWRLGYAMFRIPTP